MTRQDYDNRRATLMQQVTEAQALADHVRMNNLMDQVDKLDADYQAAAIQAANTRAMTMAPAAVNFNSLSRPVTNAQAVAQMDNDTQPATQPTTREAIAASADYHSAYLKALKGDTLTPAEKQTMENMRVAEGMQATAVSAPATIPTETITKIMGKIRESPLLDAINIMHIPGNISIPVEGTVNEASWVEMGTASTDSGDTITSVQLAAYKLIKTVEITADLAHMAIPAFEAWLVDRLGRKIRAAMDIAVISGDGTNKATGMLHGSELTQKATFTSGGMKYDDLTKIIAALPSEYRPTAKFAMPSDLFYGDVLAMTDTAGRPIVVSDVQAPSKYNVLGYPVILDDNITTDNLLYGDFYETYILNLSMDPVVSRDESVAFRTGSTVYRAMALADGKVVNKKAMVKASRGG